MTVLEQLQKAIEDGHPGDTEKLVREALKQHISSARIVEEAMTPAMRTVGENYKSNGADIIRILAAARSVRKGFELLEEQDTQFGKHNTLRFSGRTGSIDHICQILRLWSCEFYRKLEIL